MRRTWRTANECLYGKDLVPTDGNESNDTRLLEYRNPRTARTSFNWRAVVIAGLFVAALHVVGSHIILFHIHSLKFYDWTGPGGPVDTELVQRFEFPLYPQDTYWMTDMGKWDGHFMVLAVLNGLLWGSGASAAVFAMAVAIRKLPAR